MTDFVREALDTLPLTGERTVPGIPEENYWFRRHEAAYEFAGDLVSGTVLEVGCGEGYGTALLAPRTGLIIGVDYDELTVAHAVRTYPDPRFVRGNLAALPVRDSSIRAVVTLQVIEHVWNHAEFIGECVRVLRPEGFLLVTTPNRLTFSPGLDAPINPFHTVEFTAAELAELLARSGVEVTRTLGLHASERLRELDAVHGGSFVDAQVGTPPQEWTDRLRADVESITTADFEILGSDQRDIDASLDLIVIGRPRDERLATSD